MIFGKKRGIVGLALASCIMFTAEFQVLAATPQSETQAIETITYEMNVSPLAATLEQIPAMASVAVNTQVWSGKALANTDTTIEVYSEVDGTVIGKLFKNTVVTVEEESTEWCKVASGNVNGYVRTESLLFGSAAIQRAETVCAEGTKDAKTMEEITAEQKSGEVKLLAALIFCEAGNQPYDGKVAVGAVVMNRIASSRFPNTLEGVIYQRGQFGPAITGKLGRVLASGRIPASCYQAAQDAMNGANPIGNALFFNTGRPGSAGYKLGDHYFR